MRRTALWSVSATGGKRAEPVSIARVVLTHGKKIATRQKLIPMTEKLSPERKRLLYRAQHRGFKEADILIGHFAAARLPEMSAQEEQEFSRLLEVPDQDLYAWIIGRQPVPENYLGPVMSQLQRFDVSAQVMSGRS